MLKKIPLLLLLLSTGVTVFAAGNPETKGWWVTVEAGIAAPLKAIRTTTEAMPLDPDPASTNYYYDNYVTKQHGSSMNVGVGGGYQFMLPARDHGQIRWLPAVRVGGFYNNYASSTLKGTMWEHQVSPLFDYNYKLSSQVVWFDSQLDLFSWRKWTPFFEFGVGPALNSTSTYNESYLTPTTSPSAGFANKTSVAMAWRVGLGVNYNLPWQKRAMNVGFVYRYANLGNATSGIPDQDAYPTMKQRLTLPLRNNEFMLSFSYYL